MAPRADNIIAEDNEVQINIDEIQQIEEIDTICERAANKLAFIIDWAMETNQMDILLSIVAKSDACNASSCNSVCRMFKVIKKHYFVSEYSCGLTQIYGILIALHVNRCEDDDCNYEVCKNSREQSGNNILGQL